MIYLLLFWEFCKVSVFCVGGGYASMPLIQAGVVDGYHWLTMSEFVDIFTISQMTPGPIGINAATFAGMKTAGIFGGVAATVGFVVPSLCIGITLAKIFLKYGDIGPVRGVLNGLRPAVVGLICAASIDFILLALWNTEELPVHWSDLSLGGLVLLIVTLVAVRRHIGVITILFASGLLGLILGMAGLLTV